MYVDVPPDHEDVKVIVFPAAWVDGRDGEDDNVGIDRTEFTTTSLFILFVVAVPVFIIIILLGLGPTFVT